MRSNRKAIMAKLTAELKSRNEAAGVIVESAAKQEAPVDTGRLRSSITHTSGIDGAVIGTNVPYGAPQEFGTVNQPGKPFLRPGLLKSKPALIALYGKRI